MGKQDDRMAAHSSKVGSGPVGDVGIAAAMVACTYFGEVDLFWLRNIFGGRKWREEYLAKAKMAGGEALK